MPSVTMQSFHGVWRRTELFEPRGQLGPTVDREKIVIWVQSKHGLFIDIRVCPNAEDNLNPLNLKSFAGTGEYDSSLQHFTWTRLIDFRPPGAPDVGLMNVVSPGVVEEDGVLPGDDFKEVWTQQLDMDMNLDACDDFVCEVMSVCGKRQGYFMIVGDYFAFTLCRESVINAESLNNYFEDGGDLSEEEKNNVMKYVCVMGRTTDWIVQYSLDVNVVGSCILPERSALSALLTSLQWTVLEGVPPEPLASLIVSKNSGDLTTS